MTLLEKVISEGRVNLEKLSDVSLVNDYRKFKFNKIINKVIMKEMEKRSKETKQFKMIDKGESLILGPKNWEYRSSNTLTTGEYPVPDDIQKHFIRFGPKLFAAIAIRETIAAIRKDVKQIHIIRNIIQQNGEIQKYFPMFYASMKELEKLNPFHPDLYFGMTGKPFSKSFIDR